MELMDMLFSKSVFGESGSGSGGGATVLGHVGQSAEVLPFNDGTADANYYRLWDNTPTPEEMVGGFFVETGPAESNILNGIPFSENGIIVSEESEFQLYCVNVWGHDESHEPLFGFLVIAEDIIEGDFVIKSGIYVHEGLCDSPVFPIWLVYGIPPEEHS